MPSDDRKRIRVAIYIAGGIMLALLGVAVACVLAGMTWTGIGIAVLSGSFMNHAGNLFVEYRHADQ